MPTPCPAPDGSSLKAQHFDGPPPMCIDVNKRYSAHMVTSKGDLVIALDPVAAPKTVNNFVFLARYHYYEGIVFHRVIPGFVLQGGDPTGTGTGGPGYKFEDELPRAGRYELGFPGYGQCRAEYKWQSVLRHQRPERRAPPAPILPVREGDRRPRRRGWDRRARDAVRQTEGTCNDQLSDGHGERLRLPGTGTCARLRQ